MSRDSSILIIGGGAVGLFTAYYLSSVAKKITIIEKSEVGDDDACSFGNAGFVSPSHVIPLSSPGVIQKGLKWMMDPESPFFIKPRLDLDLANWLWHFYRSSGKNKMQRSVPVLKELGVASRILYQDYANHNGNDFEYREKGLMMLYLTREGKKECLDSVDEAKRVGLKARMLSSEACLDIEPHLNTKARGAAFFPMDCHLNPSKLLASLKAHVVQRGVQIISATEVRDFDIEDGKIKEVHSTKGSHHADEYILTSGAWSAQIMRKFGTYIPLEAAKGYSITLKNGNNNRSVPLLLTEAKIAITPFLDQLRFAGTLELAGLDKNINMRRVNAILKTIPKYLNIKEGLRVDKEEVWAGLRPCSPDGLPFIGRIPSLKNGILATGHAMLGITLAPVSGKLVAEIATEKKTTLDIDALKVDRFGKRLFSL